MLLLLVAGLALGLTRSPKKHWWILKKIPKEWKNINRQALERAINSLYVSHLVREKYNKDGTTTLVLSENGRQRALRFNINKMEIRKPIKWDRKWRIVMFDVPEKLRRLRDSLRLHFREIGLIELQKSVFVYPYPCSKEIEFILEFYNARKYVRSILAEKIDNQLHLMGKFGLC
ncbi:MAG: Phenylacetic acid degradation operon transcriptional regulator, paaX family [Candidatus Nomurabacteria bacterium GW2011_GWF2_43_24]|uniref:Phenylacetic acid degradation operon transcriptional regulator, paaX family n=1 Tax=Candidatus Nomurabacteria bacterium GW2011_GWF2_43_24 TaxID=1618778 RepID=A0A0G1GVJ6_9BACT|nr:MAG: Phenylacetic acid degradation operon transcriptional regulator, paaX family [Candidatus Nomurabacteria bacterium GW2011_GWF1_42_40]KKT07838.1 MAG: Phenylacetic acid degradation operon transcriptional regulator, paaX family [Candidatus Nomurabacteria bacterium GW2011_GWB1_43_19]KKT11407.1 MAG: Phenylacetic acid degradation operon transcriptional regulator, paaX family [Candidatus Nomurabacteria bacterium GW2011_GWF2_43_24]